MTESKDGEKTALVTGASVGIGYALARLCAKNGYRTVLISRDKSRLEGVAREIEEEYGKPAIALPMDLTRSRAADAIVEHLQKESIQLDVLVNNAGFGGAGAFHSRDTQRDLDMIELNVTAMVHLTRLVLPSMIQRGSGKILNVASTAAFQPGPFMAVYYATKAFVVSFSEAVGTELEGTGVSMTTLCPGPTRTEFHERAGMGHSKFAKGGVAMDAEKVARIGYDGMMKNKRTVIAGFKNRFGVFVSTRMMPRWLVLRLVATVNRNR